MDKRKMYAHVYFDIPGNSLGIAIYSLAKIPGFSGKLDPQLKDLTGHGKAYSLFLDTLGSGRISQEELQQGRIFQYNQLEEQVKKLELLGKLIAKDKEAQVVIDLDDLNFWFEAKLGELSSSQRDLIRKKLPQDQKDSLASQFREETLSELKSVSNVEELYDAMQKMYISVSRSISPQTGPKDFKEKSKYPRPSPPTFLTSKEYNILYYPGFRGAHHMRQIPQSDALVYPKGSSEQKWMQTLITNTAEYTGMPLSNIKIEELDYITEVLAKMFFFHLSDRESYEFSHFKNAAKSFAYDQVKC